MASYNKIIVALDATVVDIKLDMFSKLKNFIVNELDEDSAATIGGLFDKFKDTNSADFAAPKNAVASKKGKGKKADADAAPKKKRGPSAYNIYVSRKVKELRAADATLKPRDAMGQAGNIWKSLSPDEQKAFKDQLAAEKADELAVETETVVDDADAEADEE